MQDGNIYLDEQLIDGLRQTIDDKAVANLLAEFIAMLEAVRSELDRMPHESVEAVRFIAVKLRGSAAEYGAVRLAEVARTMEQALLTSSKNVVDWRLLLRAEIGDTIQAFRQKIRRLGAMPAPGPRLKLVSGD